MSRLPTVSARELVKALLKAGFVKEHQRGSHLNLYNQQTGGQTVVLMHSGDLHRGLVKDILKQADITEEEFRRLL